MFIVIVIVVKRINCTVTEPRSANGTAYRISVFIDTLYMKPSMTTQNEVAIPERGSFKHTSLVNVD